MSANNENDKPSGTMIKAGLEAFFKYDRRFEEPYDCVLRIWQAMDMARTQESAGLSCGHEPLCKGDC